MFPEGMPNMEGLLEQAQQMQEQLMNAQQELEEARVEGTAGGGLVTATVTGTGDLVGLDIDREACDPDDTESLADLIIAAVRDASTRAQEDAARRFGPLAGMGEAPKVGTEQGGPVIGIPPPGEELPGGGGGSGVDI
ncbi:MAG: YbaB/EbfC family nucleoid-associated protein [Propionibacteriales bacterium]|nr:YbaB/EbfC family nucleoid-associated protein [Propionibacteriales bacterium]